MENLLKRIADESPELIDENYREFLDRIGFDNFIYFVKNFGGTVIYIPQLKKIFSKCIAENVRQEFNGANIKALARKYDLCERTIRNYIYRKG